MLVSVEYDDIMSSYVAILDDDRVVLLGADTYHDAEEEAREMVESGECESYT